MYEQMFYHVPVRRSQSGQVERERERETGSVLARSSDSRICGTRGVKLDSNGAPGIPNARNNHRILAKQPIQLVSETQICMGTRPQGFPVQISPWCRKLKIDKVKTPFSSERGLTTRKDRNIVEYLGIAADEPKRFGQLNDKKRAPLVEFGIDEDLCGLYCQYNDMLSPSYETSFRDGCWFCHNQGIAQLRHLRKNYPDLWALLMKWDLDSPVSFKADGHTVHDFDRRFQLEQDGLIPIGKNFRWDWLDNPPGTQMTLF